MNPQSLSTLQAPTPATLKTNTLQSVQTILNYKFTNQALTWEALQAGGSSFPSEGTQVDGGKRLAIVGDVVLKLALMEDWYHSGASKGTNLHNFKGGGKWYTAGPATDKY